MSAAQSSDPAFRRQPASVAHTSRLAELVMHLTGCAPERALRAVEAAHPILNDPLNEDEALAVVARAMVAVRNVDLRDSVDLRETTDLREQKRQTPIA
jgi:chemotaxis regulatin CheY-phosphate phosphatase CheZ